MFVAFAVLSPTFLTAEAGSQAADRLQQRGIAYAESGRYAEARQAFEKLVALRPGDGDALTLLGLAEFRERRYDDALKHLESARTLTFRTDGLYRLLEYHSALILILRADFDSAQKRLDKLAKLTVNTPELTRAQGVISLHKRTLPEDLGDQDARLADDVGGVVVRTNRLPFDDALRTWTGLLQRHPNTQWLEYSFGMFLVSAGKIPEAIAAFEAEAHRCPEVAPVLQIAACKLMLGEPESALDYADRAVHTDANLFAGHLLRGRALLNLGRDAEAVTALETAVRLAPMSDRAYGLLQTAYARVGRAEDARRAATQAERLRDRP